MPSVSDGPQQQQVATTNPAARSVRLLGNWMIRPWDGAVMAVVVVVGYVHARDTVGSVGEWRFAPRARAGDLLDVMPMAASTVTGVPAAAAGTMA